MTRRWAASTTHCSLRPVRITRLLPELRANILSQNRTSATCLAVILQCFNYQKKHKSEYPRKRSALGVIVDIVENQMSWQKRTLLSSLSFSDPPVFNRSSFSSQDISATVRRRSFLFSEESLHRLCATGCIAGESAGTIDVYPTLEHTSSSSNRRPEVCHRLSQAPLETSLCLRSPSASFDSSSSGCSSEGAT